MSRYAANLRVVNHDDGSSRLSEMKRLFALAAEERERRHAQPPVTVEEAREQFRRVEAGSGYEPDPPQGAPPCHVGSFIWMHHELGRDWHCARCGWKCPSPELNGRGG